MKGIWCAEGSDSCNQHLMHAAVDAELHNVLSCSNKYCIKLSYDV